MQIGRPGSRIYVSSRIVVPARMEAPQEWVPGSRAAGYNQVLVALLNASARWEPSGNAVLLLSTTDSMADLQYNASFLSQVRYNGTRMPFSVVRSCFATDGAAAPEGLLGSFIATTVDCAPIQEVSIGVCIASVILALCSECLSTVMESYLIDFVEETCGGGKRPASADDAATAHVVVEVPPGGGPCSPTYGGAVDVGGRI